MVFASVDQVGRIERAVSQSVLECALMAQSRHPGRDTWIRELAGGYAGYTGPNSPLNKVAGLGFTDTFDFKLLAEVEEELGRRGAPVQVELSTLADPSLGEALSKRGYVLVAFENVLGCELPKQSLANASTSNLAVKESPDSDLAQWLDVIVSGFAAPDEQGTPSHESFPREALEEILGDMARVPGFKRYLVQREGSPIAAGSMQFAGEFALFCGAATLPEHRRQGAQTKLLSERLRIAATTGSELAVVTTQPGSKSQQNAEKHGFQLLYSRAIMVLSPPEAR